jgi:hypothetical protein
LLVVGYRLYDYQSPDYALDRITEAVEAGDLTLHDGFFSARGKRVMGHVLQSEEPTGATETVISRKRVDNEYHVRAVVRSDQGVVTGDVILFTGNVRNN